MDNDSRRANAIAKSVLILSVWLVLAGTLCFVFFRSQYRLVPSNEYCRCENLDQTNEEASTRLLNEKYRFMNETYRLVNGTYRFWNEKYRFANETYRFGNETYRIVNGTSSKALERGLPWMSFLFQKKHVGDTAQVQIFCTSTVITRYWVLTGKHQKSQFKRLQKTPFKRLQKTPLPFAVGVIWRSPQTN